ncbi:MAG: ABC transporter permease [Acidobacteria bacterium]|nr:ABC transporter permease [Acidobacteriota bacterium]
MHDIRHGLRGLMRTPGFTCTALLALSLGIGAATTVFSVVDRVLFRPLPYVAADRLVTVGGDIRSQGMLNWAVATSEFDAWRRSNRTLSDLAGYQSNGRATLKLPDEPVEIPVTQVTQNFLSLLGFRPALGRPLVAADFEPGAPAVMLMLNSAWQRLYAANVSVIGSTVTLNDTPTVIVGVLPDSFVFPGDNSRNAPEIMTPLIITHASAGSRVTMIGRLADHVAIESARAEIDAMARTRAGESGLRNARIDGASVEFLSEALTKKPRTVMSLLLGAVAALLAIGCANVANLLLARGTDRQGELALRKALGASRGSLVRMLLAESAILAVIGGAAGIALAYWAVGAIQPLVPADLTTLGPIAVDRRALFFTTAVSALCVLLAGLGPALTSAGRQLTPTISRSTSRATRARFSVRRTIVAVEVGLAVVLLVAGGLMVNAMVRLLAVDSGYRSSSVLTMRVQLPRGLKYPARSQRFVLDALDAARRVPGVVVAAASEGVPLANTLYAGHYRVDGFSEAWMKQGASNGSGPCCTQTQTVSKDYFDASGIGLVRGRGFVSSDATASERVALINERLARKFPTGTDPIGHYLVSEDDETDRRLIVGIARDVRDMSIERRSLQTIYLPLEERGASAISVLMRTTSDPTALATAARNAIQQQAGPVVITDVRTLDEVVARSTGQRRWTAWLFGSFGVVGLLLTAVGIASVIAYSVAQRTRELGVRLALGASPAAVRRLVLADSLAPVMLGGAAGLVAAWALSRYVATLLYEVTPRDGWTYAAVVVLLIGTALIASYVPARRAARIDPIIALRCE